MLTKLKQDIRDCLPTMRKVAAWADHDPNLGEEWARQFSRMINDIEDNMLAEQGDDGAVIS